MLNHNPRSRKTNSREGSSSACITVGTSFTVRELATGELEFYTLVRPEGADISRNQVSTLTPLGQAIAGRQAGDIVEYLAPGGLVQMRIESVQAEPIGDLTVEIP